ncbi:pyridoxal phosphate-dependent aminotransferase [Enterococcus sp. BWB1-3]|uniref:MalY/PatB family protein n=1 Tax=Enterococcus sp. BWB1-3 TaxID=2787713 RepID=UPI001921E384|nr:MalY/PatB family protein [Enterococcus sp. BWB1-3]MBL1228954.1 pyridoxal phosphate-dependent aminotransferase [Enterococcus sp. BWB1-3]
MVNFDHVYERKGTNSVKWDAVNKMYKEDDLLPLWVADMDFKVHQPILDAMISYINQGILGYTTSSDSLYEAVQTWQKKKHNYIVEKEAILFSSGVVPSVAIAIQAYTEVGDAVLIHDPVYHPFAKVIKKNKRRVIRHSLIEVDGKFQIDFEKMKEAIQTNDVKLFILCNPHNPGGRVWSIEELKKIGELCASHNVLIISDEIHQDLIFTPAEFTTFNNADPSFKDFSITLTAATKTFNLAGIKNSMAFIHNTELRAKFCNIQEINQQTEINTIGLLGTEAAYRCGEEWLDDLLIYLQKNISTVEKFLQSEMPLVKIMKPEGTYLIWLDFSAYALSDKELENKLIKKGKVVLNSGISFGPKGSQHMRLNIACPNATLLEGLERMKKSFQAD